MLPEICTIKWDFNVQSQQVDLEFGAYKASFQCIVPGSNLKNTTLTKCCLDWNVHLQIGIQCKIATCGPRYLGPANAFPGSDLKTGG